MRLRTVNVPYKTGDVFSLYPIGDVHLGSVNCDKDLFDATIKRIRDDPKALWPNVRVIGPRSWTFR